MWELLRLNIILTLTTQNQQVAQINKQYCKRSSAMQSKKMCISLESINRINIDC